MSTRGQVRFTGPHGTTVQVYRHSDSYPEGVLPDLAQLFRVMRNTGTVRDSSYAAANFIFFGKLRSMRLYYAGSWEDADRGYSETISTSNPYRVMDPDEFEAFGQPHFLLGYGVEPVGKWHGDEEFLYDVTFTRQGYPAVRVAERGDFPRWEELDELPDDSDPWEEVSWSFDGSLRQALAEYTDAEPWELPEEGDVLRDPDTPSWSTGEVVVTGVTDTPAFQYDIDTGTVAEVNPDEPADAPVVEGEYRKPDGGTSKEYAFPVSRLES